MKHKVTPAQRFWNDVELLRKQRIRESLEPAADQPKAEHSEACRIVTGGTCNCLYGYDPDADPGSRQAPDALETPEKG